MRFGKQIAATIILILISFFIPPGVQAQTATIEVSVEYEFGEQITFRALVESETPIQSATIFFQAHQDTRTNIGQAEVTPLSSDRYEIIYTHDLRDYTFRAFSPIEYYYEFEMQDGETQRSETAEFYYRDNRFEWQELAESPFRVFWYEGDRQFAQDILDTAQDGLLQIRSMLSIDLEDTLDIYVYADARSMQDTLNPNSAGWIAGHTDPDLGIVVVSLPPGPERPVLVQQRIPHEVMHVALYQATYLGYENLPNWLNEGLATRVEQYENPDYEILLEHAQENENLLSISSLCERFPRDASGALLAYAQSASFTQYLYDMYGSSGMNRLIAAYADGLSCEQGAKVALGTGLTQLDRQWRRDSLAENVGLTAFLNLLPWFILLLVVMGAPIGLAMALRRPRSGKTTASESQV